MPPGLYEIVIRPRSRAPKPRSEDGRPAISICHRGTQSRRHPRAGLQLARGRARVRCCRTRFRAQQCPLSDLPAALDQDGERPTGRAAVLELNPLRLGYSLPSDRNPMMRGVAPTANYVRAERTPASTDNPFIAMQQQFSKTMVDTLSRVRPRLRRSPIFVRRCQGPHAQSRAGTYDPRTGGLPSSRPDRTSVSGAIVVAANSLTTFSEPSPRLRCRSRVENDQPRSVSATLSGDTGPATARAPSNPDRNAGGRPLR